MRKVLSWIPAGFSILVFGASTAGAITLSDGVFADGDWLTEVIMRGPDGTSDGSGMQVSSGGNLDEYREVFAARDPLTAGLDNSTGVYSFFDTAYDLSAMGAIAELDFTIDTIQFGGGSGGSLTPALRQADVIYIARFVGQTMGDTSWTPHEFLDLTESDFRDPDMISSLPDFSSAGSAIEFGWVYVVSSASGDPVSRTVGFDNWVLAITPVPEPGTASLMGIGFVGLALAAQRRHRVSA